MSRYTIPLPDKRTLVYGYDPPLSEYFVTLYPNNEDSKKDPDMHVLWSVMTHTTTDPHPDYPDKIHWYTDELVELIESLTTELPENHKLAMAFDQPF